MYYYLTLSEKLITEKYWVFGHHIKKSSLKSIVNEVNHLFLMVIFGVDI